MKYKVGQKYTAEQVATRISEEIQINAKWVAQWRAEGDGTATLVGFKKYPNGVNHA